MKILVIRQDEDNVWLDARFPAICQRLLSLIACFAHRSMGCDTGKGYNTVPPPRHDITFPPKQKISFKGDCFENPSKYKKRRACLKRRVFFRVTALALNLKAGTSQSSWPFRKSPATGLQSGCEIFISGQNIIGAVCCYGS